VPAREEVIPRTARVRRLRENSRGYEAELVIAHREGGPLTTTTFVVLIFLTIGLGFVVFRSK
jgi:hypothetical protein